MQKKALFALLLVAVVALSGCSLVVKDSAVDARRVIVDVNGQTVDKQTVNAQIDYQLSYEQQMYQQNYGYTIDITAESIRKEMTDSVIDSMVKELVTMQKVKELGYDQFTDEETAEIQTSSDEEYASMIDTIKLLYLSDSDKEGDELTAEAEAFAAQRGLTKENSLSDAKSTKERERLRESVVKDVTVSDDEVKADFDSKVESAKTSYENNLNAYGTAYNNGTTVYYAPAGYRSVKQVFVQIASEDSTQLSSLNTELTAANTTLTSTQTAVTENETELAKEGLKDEEKAALEETKAALAASLQDAQKKVDDLTAQINELTEKAFAAIKPEADEVYQKAAAGEDFAALIEQYNDDPGMKREPGKTKGYAVCANYSSFEASFVNAAMALKAIGDVSEPIKGSSGYFIIRYENDIPEGAVALSEVQDSIKSTLLSTKQDAAYDAAVESWVAAATVKTYADRLTD